MRTLGSILIPVHYGLKITLPMALPPILGFLHHLRPSQVF